MWGVSYKQKVAKRNVGMKLWELVEQGWSKKIFVCVAFSRSNVFLRQKLNRNRVVKIFFLILLAVQNQISWSGPCREILRSRCSQELQVKWLFMNNLNEFLVQVFLNLSMFKKIVKCTQSFWTKKDCTSTNFSSLIQVWIFIKII